MKRGFMPIEAEVVVAVGGVRHGPDLEHQFIGLEVCQRRDDGNAVLILSIEVPFAELLRTALDRRPAVAEGHLRLVRLPQAREATT
jgi:hypothetical protein